MQAKFEENFKQSLGNKQYSFLDFISKEIAVSKRPIEALILKKLLNQLSTTDDEIISELKSRNIFYDKDSLDNVASILDLSYFVKKKREKYGDMSLIQRNDGIWKFTTEFQSALQSSVFKKYFIDAIETNLWNLHKSPTAYHDRFTIGKKYYRYDVIKMLNWEKEPNYLSVGGYSLRQDGCFLPVFISLKKTENFQNKMVYKNTFLDRSTIPLFSKVVVQLQAIQKVKLLKIMDLG